MNRGFIDPSVSCYQSRDGSGDVAMTTDSVLQGYLHKSPPLGKRGLKVCLCRLLLVCTCLLYVHGAWEGEVYTVAIDGQRVHFQVRARLPSALAWNALQPEECRLMSLADALLSRASLKSPFLYLSTATPSPSFVCFETSRLAVSASTFRQLPSTFRGRSLANESH